jgi:hypothetical protein
MLRVDGFGNEHQDQYKENEKGKRYELFHSNGV